MPVFLFVWFWVFLEYFEIEISGAEASSESSSKAIHFLSSHHGLFTRERK